MVRTAAAPEIVVFDPMVYDIMRETATELGGALNRTLHAIEPLLMRVAIGQRESAP